MTDLRKLQEAKEYIEQLANGINPVTKKTVSDLRLSIMKSTDD